MKTHKQALLSVAVSIISLLLIGCATPVQVATPAPADRVDDLIAKYAASATNSLRVLSESEGSSRAVTSSVALAPGEGAVISNHGLPKAVSGRVVQTSAVPVIEKTPRTTGGLLSATPDGLSKLLTVRWTGDIEELIDRICSEVGWTKERPVGLRVSPVIISVEALNVPAYEILRDMGAISGGAADIVVSAAKRSISVRYPTR